MTTSSPVIPVGLTAKGKRVVQLFRAIRSAGVFPPGTKIPMADEEPATYIGPADVQDGVQMHEFHLHDGTEVLLEVEVLTEAMMPVSVSVA